MGRGIIYLGKVEGVKPPKVLIGCLRMCLWGVYAYAYRASLNVLVGCLRGAKPLFSISLPLPYQGRGTKGVGYILLSKPKPCIVLPVIKCPLLDNV